MSDMNHGVRAGYEDDAPKPLDDAVFDALIRGGDDLLKDAHRFVSLVCDFADLNLPAVVLLRRNCDNTYLAPFDRLATQSRGVTQDDFVGAMREACEYLVSTRNVTDTKCAKDATSQVAHGLYQYLQNSMRTSGLYKPNIWKIEPKIDSESDTGELSGGEGQGEHGWSGTVVVPGGEGQGQDGRSGQGGWSGQGQDGRSGQGGWSGQGQDGRSGQGGWSGQGQDGWQGPDNGGRKDHNPLRKVAIVVGALLLFAALGIGSFFVANRTLRTTVTFNGNGADSGTVQSQSALKGDTIELPDNDYVREGYAFAGWSPERKHGNLYDVGETVTVNDNITFYAIWRTGISFDSNGATTGETQTVYADDYGMIELPECGFEMDGYVFSGWTDASRSKEYQPGDKVSDTGSSMVLYATWEEDGTAIWEPPSNPNAYILPDSNTRLYTYDEANKFTNEQLYYARNEIYARYGRGFVDPILTNYFNTKNWYHKTMEWNQWNDLYGGAEPDGTICNNVEKENWKLFYRIENERQSDYLDRWKMFV